MSTVSNRSAGTQKTQRGIAQGNVILDPISGLPVDVIEDSLGKKRLAVDANFTAQNVDANVELDFDEDSVSIGDATSGNTLAIEADGSINTNVVIDSASGDNIAIVDSDGNELNVNPDGSLNITLSGIEVPNIQNIDIVSANTEQSYTFPNNTKKFAIGARGNSKLQFSYTSMSSTFVTIYPGNNYEESGIVASSITIYFQGNKAGDKLEVLSWK